VAASRRRSKKRAPPPAPAVRRTAAKKAPASADLDTVSWWDDFYRVVRRIPRGQVTTYGAVALLAGYPRAARHVGWAMAALKETGKNRDVPWQRVLGAAPGKRARVTIKDPVGGAVQRAMLEAEGVAFDRLGRVELARFGWSGQLRPATAADRRRPRAPAPTRRAPRSRPGTRTPRRAP
jgi:methylated-DNA-protein-cysteine methyltransferase-like protein